MIGIMPTMVLTSQKLANKIQFIYNFNVVEINEIGCSHSNSSLCIIANDNLFFHLFIKLGFNEVVEKIRMNEEIAM